MDQIQDRTQLGLKSGEDTDGNAVDVENLNPEQRANLDKEWFADSAAKLGISLRDLYEELGLGAPTEVRPTVTDTKPKVDASITDTKPKVGTPITDTKPKVGTPITDIKKWVETNVRGKMWGSAWGAFKADTNKINIMVAAYKSDYDKSGGADSGLRPPREFRTFLADNRAADDPDFGANSSLVNYVNRFLSPESEQEGGGGEGNTGLGGRTPLEVLTKAREDLSRLTNRDDILAYGIEGIDKKTDEGKRLAVLISREVDTRLAELEAELEGKQEGLMSRGKELARRGIEKLGEMGGKSGGAQEEKLQLKQDRFFDRLIGIMGTKKNVEIIINDIVDPKLEEEEAINYIIEKFIEPNNKLFTVPGSRKGATTQVFPYSNREKEQAFLSLGKRLYDSLKIKAP